MSNNYRKLTSNQPRFRRVTALNELFLTFYRGIAMKRSFKLLSTVAAFVVACPVAMADSQYGYSPSGATGVTAQASVTVTVNVPTLILLRVGSATAVDTLTFTAALSGVTSAPTAATLTGLAANVSNQAANWDGTTAPTFAAPTGQALAASAWTNSRGGGSVAMVSTAAGGNTATGITPANITVTASASPAGFTHPANTGSAAFTGTFAKNTVLTSNWTYGIAAATLNAAGAGTYTQTTVYTATAL